MTKTENRLTSNHKIYGGKIDLEDFSTTLPNKERINNQIAANDLEKELENMKRKRKEEKMYENYTQEELKEMRLISNTNGRPIYGLTDEKWQKEFRLRKMFITPYPKNVRKMGGRYSKESGMWNEETQGTYNGATNYQEYCFFINDVLNTIRSKQVDYIYYIYQIMDLLKFHYDDLRTKYCDGYWEVWLEKKKFV